MTAIEALGSMSGGESVGRGTAVVPCTELVAPSATCFTFAHSVQKYHVLTVTMRVKVKGTVAPKVWEEKTRIKKESN